MRLTTVLLLAATLQVSATGFGQGISISGKKLSLEKVFASIEEQTHYSFVYKYNALLQAQAVTIRVKNADIRDVLETCLKGQGLEYTIEKNIIAIKKTEDKAPDAAVKAEPPARPIQGTVRNQQGEVLAGVTVLVKGTGRHTLTNDKGEFNIEADENDVLLFTFVGYKPLQLTAGPGKILDVMMSVADESLHEIVVTALGIRRSEKSLTYATQQVKGDELTRAKTDNLMNSLNGKVAGLTISPALRVWVVLPR